MIVRIGTTGDYPPLTEFHAKTRTFSGFAIDVAKAIFGDAAQFRQTTWSVFEAELEAQQFDVAMGGVTLTQARQQRFLASKPIFSEGKLPITHEDNAGQFQSIQAINQPHVRVAYNPGGTNEQFAKTHFGHAKLIRVNDNQAIFPALVQKEIDVFVTDGVEARYQAYQYPELMAQTLPVPFTNDQIGFLIRLGRADLRDQIDAWLQSDAFIQLRETLPWVR